MLVTSLPAMRTFRPLSWPTVAVAFLLIHAALSIAIPESRALTAYGLITYFLVLVLGSGIAALNAVQSRKAIRLFWSFLAMALAFFKTGISGDSDSNARILQRVLCEPTCRNCLRS